MIVFTNNEYKIEILTDASPMNSRYRLNNNSLCIVHSNKSFINIYQKISNQYYFALYQHLRLIAQSALIECIQNKYLTT